MFEECKAPAAAKAGSHQVRGRTCGHGRLGRGGRRLKGRQVGGVQRGDDGGALADAPAGFKGGGESGLRTHGACTARRQAQRVLWFSQQALGQGGRT